MPAVHWESDGERTVRQHAELNEAAYQLGQIAREWPLLRYVVNTLLILGALLLVGIAVVSLIMFGRV